MSRQDETSSAESTSKPELSWQVKTATIAGWIAIVFVFSLGWALWEYRSKGYVDSIDRRPYRRNVVAPISDTARSWFPKKPAQK